MSDAPKVRTSAAELELALASMMIAAGGVLLGVQVDSVGRVHGTGYDALALGILAALFATLLSAGKHFYVPRDAVSGWAALCGFVGMAFAVAGVLVPAGPWLFVEWILLVWIFARGRGESLRVGPSIGPGAIVVLALMLVFRLWITYQASRGRFSVASIDVPIISMIPLSALDPLKSIDFGTFTPDELNLPPSDGLNFPITMGAWAVGFGQVALGLWWRASAAREHEDDRVHATIQELPGELARMVETLIPESEWASLGLHGLSERKLKKRIEELVRERIGRAQQVERSLKTLPLNDLRAAGGFTGGIGGALEHGDPRGEGV